MAIRFLYLIRHGNYNMYEKPDELGNGLSDLGKHQAELTGKYFQSIPVTTIHASTMRRAMETAQIIAQSLPFVTIHPSRLLWESIPVIPARLRDQFMQKHPDLTAERVAEQRSYADQAFETYFKPLKDEEDTHELLVCHGNLIRYFVCRVLGMDGAGWANMIAFHCGITRFIVDDDGLCLLVSYNELSHLPTDFHTE